MSEERGTGEARLSEIVARLIVSEKEPKSIKPAWIATAAMKELDPDRVSIADVYLGCHLQLRQMARGMLREKFEDNRQGDLFLQKRYPAAHSVSSDEPEYVLLAAMSASDIDYNVSRLRSEGRAKLKHADALERYGRERFSETAA